MAFGLVLLSPTPVCFTASSAISRLFATKGLSTAFGSKDETGDTPKPPDELAGVCLAVEFRFHVDPFSCYCCWADSSLRRRNLRAGRLFVPPT